MDKRGKKTGVSVLKIFLLVAFSITLGLQSPARGFFPDPFYNSSIPAVKTANSSIYGLQEISETDKVLYPAIFLKYFVDQNNDGETIENIGYAVEAASIIIGAGGLSTAIRAGRYGIALLELADIIGSGLSLTSGALNEDEEKLLRSYQAVVGILSLRDLFSSPKKMKDAFKMGESFAPPGKSSLAKFQEFQEDYNALKSFSNNTEGSKLAHHAGQLNDYINRKNLLAISRTVDQAYLLDKLKDYRNLKNWVSNSLNNSDDLALMSKLDNLDASKLNKLNDDITAPGLKGLFKDNPDAVESWKFLDEAGVDETLRQNVDALTDPDAALDAIQMSQKTKPTWPEIQALWKRGNDFNAKGRAKYGDDFVEVVLKGVDGKAGKRLDTYLPPSNGQAGQIISRKATTLSEIQPNTFKNYLNELITKYPKGAELNSSKFPSGTKLDGDYFLEIPISNKSFFESSTEFQKVLSDFNTAKGVDIKIKYLAE